MLDFKQIAELALEACGEFAQQLPVKHREVADQRITSLRTMLASAQPVGAPNQMAKHWEDYRNSQKFVVEHIDTQREVKCLEDCIITGYAALVELTGLKESTLRQRISMGRGVMKRLSREHTSDYSPIQLIITRINTR
jgi:hypothetical protein